VPDRGDETEERCFAAEVRPGIYFLDYVKHRELATSVSLVLDTGSGIATALTGILPDAAEAGIPLSERAAQGEELTAVSATFLSGAIDRVFTPDTGRHLPTLDLVGRRMEYTYSPTECYEHVYLNEHFYTWHCLAGAEQGLADTDRCHHRKIAEDLYLFVWREKIVPTLGVVLLDLKAMRTVGKIFGYQGAGFDQVANFVVGARARLVNVTTRG
jgi:MoaF C-terminal domain/MoaF N-terminal domain